MNIERKMAELKIRLPPKQCYQYWPICRKNGDSSTVSPHGSVQDTYHEVLLT